MNRLVRRADGRRTAVLLHGYGSNEQDLFGLVAFLPKDFPVIALRAWEIAPEGGFAWFPIEWGPAGVMAKATDVRHAAERLADEVPSTLREEGLPEANPVWIGFSQGGILALEAMRLDSGPTAVAALAGCLVEPIPNPGRRGECTVLVQHGIYDEVVPIERVRASVATLQNEGVIVTNREYVMGHELRPEALADLNTWLRDTAH